MHRCLYKECYRGNFKKYSRRGGEASESPRPAGSQEWSAGGKEKRTNVEGWKVGRLVEGWFWARLGGLLGAPFSEVVGRVFGGVLVPILGPLLEAAGSRNPMNLKGFEAFRLSRGDTFGNRV